MKNFWIKDELDTCIKLLQSWLEDHTRGAVFSTTFAMTDLITQFYTSHAYFFDYMDKIQVEFEEHIQVGGGIWYCGIHVKKYE